MRRAYGRAPHFLTLSNYIRGMDIYREHLLDHYHHPRGWGLRETVDIQERGFNILCGDEVTVQLVLKDDVIRAMYFEGKGCVLSRAAASLLTEYVLQQSIVDIMGLSAPDMETIIGITVPPARLSCVVLPLKTIQLALAHEQ